MDIRPILAGYDLMQIGKRAGGSWTNTSPWKLLLHTIEGTWESAISAYQRVGNPHATVSLDRDIYTQHVRLDRSAYAIRGGKLNRDNVIQVELEGYAADVPTWSTMKLHKLVFNVVQPILLAVPGIAWRWADFSVMQYGDRAPQRFSEAQWDSFGGILGHAHAPSPNTHWDPGMLNARLTADMLEVDE